MDGDSVTHPEPQPQKAPRESTEWKRNPLERTQNLKRPKLPTGKMRMRSPALMMKLPLPFPARQANMWCNDDTQEQDTSTAKMTSGAGQCDNKLIWGEKEMTQKSRDYNGRVDYRVHATGRENR